MWQVDNRTPLAAQGYFVRDREGAEYWVVAVRGKFRVSNDGRTEPHENQVPPRLAPSYTDKDNLELEEEPDFAPFRPGVDIFLKGSAHAYDPNPIAVHPFGFRIGDLQKAADARPARRIRKRGGAWELIRQDQFQPVPLRWAEALGGIDPFASNKENAAHPVNPVGRGWSDNLDRAPDGTEIELPRLENLTGFYHPQKPMPQPVGFGPIQPSWQQRRVHAGTYDEAWRKSRAPLLPQDFSELFYHAAPPDQIYSGELRGGEPVTVEGMHPDGAYSFLLPRLHLRVKTKFAGRWNDHRFRLITVSIDGTEKTVDMVWNAHLLCTGRDHQIDESQVVLLRQLRSTEA